MQCWSLSRTFAKYKTDKSQTFHKLFNSDGCIKGLKKLHKTFHATISINV